MTEIRLTILGSAGSTGVPAIGNHWGKCDPEEPKNRRLRPSVLVQSETTTILIDTGPDLREQFNRIDQASLDAVLYTHPHADHINGIDELRLLSLREKKIYDLYGDEITLREIEIRFDHMFNGSEDGFYSGRVKPIAIDGPFRVGDIDITPIRMKHGSIHSLGYRFGDVAYCTDVSDLDEDGFKALEGLKTWIVDAGNGFNEKVSPVHANVQTILEWEKRLKPELTYLTHLTFMMDYKTTMDATPDNVLPAYDGLVITGTV